MLDDDHFAKTSKILHDDQIGMEGVLSCGKHPLFSLALLLNSNIWKGFSFFILFRYDFEHLVDILSIIVGYVDSLGDKSKRNVVEIKGRFSVTSENVDLAKVSAMAGCISN